MARNNIYNLLLIAVLTTLLGCVNCQAGTCPDGQEWVECIKCEQTCDSVTNLRGPMMCTHQCTPGCQCKGDNVLNSEKQCVPPSKCPCTENAFYNTKCGTACPATCENYKAPPSPCAAVCRFGCTCNSGYVIDNKSGKCVLKENCPP